MRKKPEEMTRDELVLRVTALEIMNGLLRCDYKRMVRQDQDTTRWVYSGLDGEPMKPLMPPEASA